MLKMILNSEQCKGKYTTLLDSIGYREFVSFIPVHKPSLHSIVERLNHLDHFWGVFQFSVGCSKVLVSILYRKLWLGLRRGSTFFVLIFALFCIYIFIIRGQFSSWLIFRVANFLLGQFSKCQFST